MFEPSVHVIENLLEPNYTLDNVSGQEVARAVISKALSTGGEGEGMSGPYEDDGPNIILRVGAQTRTTKSYDLDPQRVTLLYAFYKDTSDDWDSNEDSTVIFQTKEGYYGVAYKHSWSGMTFHGVNFSIDLSESQDWDLFYNFCLTDSDREVVDTLTTPSLGLASPDLVVRSFAERLCKSEKKNET